MEKHTESWWSEIPEKGLPLKDWESSIDIMRGVARESVVAITKNQRMANTKLHPYVLPGSEGFNGRVRFIPEDQTVPCCWQLLNGEVIRAGSISEDALISIMMQRWLPSAPIVGSNPRSL